MNKTSWEEFEQQKACFILRQRLEIAIKKEVVAFQNNVNKQFAEITRQADEETASWLANEISELIELGLDDLLGK